MRIAPFALERWFAEVEADADVMLAESGVRPLAAARFDTDPGGLGYVIPTAGDAGFRATVGDHHDRSAEETLFTCGTQEANLLAFLTLVEDHAVVVTPTYGSLTGLPEALGEVTRVPLEAPDWTLDPDAIAGAIEPDTDVVVVANPNNPTGRYHDAATMRAVYEHCADNGTYLLCDEVYRLLAPEPIAPVASFGRYGISTGGVSKAFGLAGLRFGWLCGPRAVLAAAANWKDYTTIAPPKIGHHVARQAFENRESILEENRAHVAGNRTRLESFLEAYGLAWSDPDCGVNAFLEVPDGFAGGESFCRSLLAEESVVLAPGEAFDRPAWVRIGFGLVREELETGLSRLGAFLDRHG
ncbi:aminotransferase class I/II-fold pyridoxal phosphate-dependent enzyme [Natronomonas sp. F2-12]|jgi:aspartate/methionine/tyrosine aminotransferase|uniref:Aminotransferase class I/II-fold pyridoxal phosphate-dependent enzyme n=1 Tax=Natronomonas aquatica TaxID=2841590 RepID=A0A9R1D651_9EURY|nr:aminotransferase class I/II-fold pyridoxal phosphate-dependent enzyme [Natronomonas aquatica]MCQ4332983.1 aminotransferase class I/II-fold pyridoxal phosphate-dependent enzyme [Natronomonas aquatica]